MYGLSQFICQTPAGYVMDYTQKKVILLGSAAVGTTILTLATTAFATDNGGNLNLIIVLKILQGAITALIPPGVNSITQGIVGTAGMTSQVSQNEMMHHWGTAVLVMFASFLAFALYPHIEFLFIMSPIACIGVVYHLSKIAPKDIDHYAARGLEDNVKNPVKSFSMEEHYYSPPSLGEMFSLSFQPSFNCGVGLGRSYSSEGSEFMSSPRVNTPFEVLKDRKMLIFFTICFTFHLSNGTVLPLVMQTLALGNGREGFLMSGLCIAVAQIFMEISAEKCGKYSGLHGRKTLFVAGLMSGRFHITFSKKSSIFFIYNTF